MPTWATRVTDDASPRILVDHLSIRHDDRTRSSPDGVTFALNPGDVVLLMGPSGSGKSTLALALNGLVPHSVPAAMSGRVVVNGVDTVEASVAHLSQSVGMVFQDADAQIVTASVLDEVCFGPENLRVPEPEILRRAEEALRRVGLWERRQENPDVLSGGGRQRLAIAAALALDADTLVLDEPTANLDAAGADDVYDALSTIVADGQRTVVLIEHDLDRAVRLVNRVIVLDREGRPVADGSPHEVLADRAEELHELGVWLPPATEAARRLRLAGVVVDPLPLTGEELTRALDAVETLPAPDVLPGVALASARANVAAGASPTDADADARFAGAGPTDPGPAIRLTGVGLTRRRNPILSDVTLDIGRGQFWAVLGVNGAGKSSLAQIIAGITKPTAGRVRVDELDPARIDAARLSQHLGFVFQNPEHQFVAHTVYDELAYGLRVRRVDEAAVRVRVDAMLDRFGLGDLAHVHPFLLSGGQKRRLSVGTALIAGASTLVLDEPTFGQDRERSDELLDLLTGLNRAGTTIVAVTHDIQLATEHADHVVVLADGRVLAADTTETILTDRALLERAGLRLPPLARAFDALTRHPDWRRVRRLDQMPGGAA